MNNCKIALPVTFIGLKMAFYLLRSVQISSCQPFMLIPFQEPKLHVQMQLIVKISPNTSTVIYR